MVVYHGMLDLVVFTFNLKILKISVLAGIFSDFWTINATQLGDKIHGILADR